MEERYYLTKVDKAKVDRLLKLAGDKSTNATGRLGDQGVDHQEILAPEVYIARTPPGGIPASPIDDIRPGTGSGSMGQGDVFEWAECQVFMPIPEGDDGNIALLRVPGLTRRVYNPYSSAIPGDTWTLVHRDKFGKWWTSTTPGRASWAADNGMENCTRWANSIDDWYEILNGDAGPGNSNQFLNRRIILLEPASPPGTGTNITNKHGPILCIPANSGRVVVRASLTLRVELDVAANIAFWVQSTRLKFDFEFDLVNIDEDGNIAPVDLYDEDGLLEARQPSGSEPMEFYAGGITQSSPVLSGQAMNLPAFGGVMTFGDTYWTQGFAQDWWSKRGEIVAQFNVGDTALRLAIRVWPKVHGSIATSEIVLLRWYPVFDSQGYTSNPTHLEYMPFQFAREKCGCTDDPDPTPPDDVGTSLAECELEVAPTASPDPQASTYLVGTSFTFAANATGGTGLITYDWQFSDGGSSTSATPSHIFRDEGDQYAYLTATDENGCKASGVVGPFQMIPDMRKRLDTDFEANATVAQTQVPKLTVNVPVGSWTLRAVLPMSNAAGTGGYAFGIDGTVTGTIKWFTNPIETLDAIVTTHGLGSSDSISAGPVEAHVLIEGSIDATAAGTIFVTFAQDTATGTSILEDGAYFEIEEAPGTGT